MKGAQFVCIGVPRIERNTYFQNEHTCCLVFEVIAYKSCPHIGILSHLPIICLYIEKLEEKKRMVFVLHNISCKHFSLASN